MALVRVYLGELLKRTNTHFENCSLALVGDIHMDDAQGNFTFNLTALVQDDGSFADPARFRSNVYSTADSDVAVLLSLVPRVEFKQCRVKAGG